MKIWVIMASIFLGGLAGFEASALHPGPQGLQGGQGQMGPSGADGLNGANGIPGPSGLPGPQGTQGQIGPRNVLFVGGGSGTAGVK